MLKIWGNDHSSCVQKVIWCAEELGLGFERVDLGGAHGGLDDPEYVALNPNRVIPTIDDDGFILWESNAIVCYLASKYGQGGLYPDDPRARGEAYRWIIWQGGTVRPAMLPLYGQWAVWKPEYRHLAELEDLRRSMLGIWRIVDDHLADRAYVAGDAFTMGDIPIGIMAHWWYLFPIDHGSMANLKAWHDRLCERPAFQTRVAQAYSQAAE